MKYCKNNVEGRGKLNPHSYSRELITRTRGGSGGSLINNALVPSQHNIGSLRIGRDQINERKSEIRS